MTDITTPGFLTAQVPGTIDTPARTIDAAWNASEGRYTAATVTISHPMNPVKTPDLARSAVRRTIAENIREQLLAANPHLTNIPAVVTWAKGEGHHARKISKSRTLEPRSIDLEHAALVVRLERIVGGFAVRTMSRCMGIDYPTAKRWMGRLKRSEMVP